VSARDSRGTRLSGWALVLALGAALAGASAGCTRRCEDGGSGADATAGSVAQQSAPAVPPVSSEGSQADVGEGRALSLAELMLSREAHAEIMRQAAGSVTTSLRAAGQALSPDRVAELESVVMEAFPYEEALELNARIYGKRFTAAELEELLSFYRTASGAKLSRELPAITRDASLAVGEMLPRRVQEALRKRGLTQ
jgi:hypothetical protein